MEKSTSNNSSFRWCGPLFSSKCLIIYYHIEQKGSERQGRWRGLPRLTPSHGGDLLHGHSLQDSRSVLGSSLLCAFPPWPEQTPKLDPRGRRQADRYINGKEASSHPLGSPCHKATLVPSLPCPLHLPAKCFSLFQGFGNLQGRPSLLDFVRPWLLISENRNQQPQEYLTHHHRTSCLFP